MFPVIPLSVSVCLVQYVCPGSPSISVSLPLCICQIISEYVCVCMRACVHVSACLPLPSVCPLSPYICLPLFRSACPSCLFLSLFCLCVPLRQSVYASPSITLTVVQSTRAALWLSQAQHFCLHGLLPIWKKKLQHILWLHWHRGKYNPGWTHNCMLITFSFSPD